MAQFRDCSPGCGPGFGALDKMRYVFTTGPGKNEAELVVFIILILDMTKGTIKIDDSSPV